MFRSRDGDRRGGGGCTPEGAEGWTGGQGYLKCSGGLGFTRSCGVGLRCNGEGVLWNERSEALGTRPGHTERPSRPACWR